MLPPQSDGCMHGAHSVAPMPPLDALCDAEELPPAEPELDDDDDEDEELVPAWLAPEDAPWLDDRLPLPLLVPTSPLDELADTAAPDDDDVEPLPEEAAPQPDATIARSEAHDMQEIVFMVPPKMQRTLRVCARCR